MRYFLKRTYLYFEYVMRYFFFNNAKLENRFLILYHTYTLFFLHSPFLSLTTASCIFLWIEIFGQLDDRYYKDKSEHMGEEIFLYTSRADIAHTYRTDWFLFVL